MQQKIGLDRLAANNVDQFVANAAYWAGDIEQLAQLRLGLRARVAESTLCNSDRASRNFHRLIRALWSKECAKNVRS